MQAACTSLEMIMYLAKLIVPCAVLAVIAAGTCHVLAGEAGTKVINVVVLTGGHGYDVKKFPALFEGYDDIKFTIVQLKDHSEIFEDISAFPYDVIVMYNMTQKITPQRQQNFLKLLEKGVGVVALHHSLACYQQWPEFARIIGAKFFLNDGEIDGVKYRKSGWKDNVRMKCRVEDPQHPITAGMSDFEVEDEAYNGQWHDPAAKVLLTTDAKENDRPLAWCKTYSKARTCGIQLGHGPAIYTDPNYRKLVAGAIRWAAAR